jgi:hypothetical protein
MFKFRGYCWLDACVIPAYQCNVPYIVTVCSSLFSIWKNFMILQKTSILGISHTVESANLKVQNMFHGRNNITCNTNCKYRRAATLYALETWYVSGL